MKRKLLERFFDSESFGNYVASALFRERKEWLLLDWEIAFSLVLSRLSVGQIAESQRHTTERWMRVNVAVLKTIEGNQYICAGMVPDGRCITKIGDVVPEIQAEAKIAAEQTDRINDALRRAGMEATP